MKKLTLLLFVVLCLVSCKTSAPQPEKRPAPPPKKTAELNPDISPDDYQFILLGDLHYDNAEHHNAIIQKAKQTEIKRNLTHWESNAPKIIQAAASQKFANTLFALQLGDITQGDAKSKEAQIALFNEALERIEKPFAERNTPFFVIKGNHDFRSPGQGEAFSETIVPLITRQLPSEKLISDGNYAFMHGPDLFVCIDCEHPDTAFLTKTIGEHQNIRHLFIFDHLPVLPCKTGSRSMDWILFGKRQGSLQSFREEFRKMLASHNAIVLAAHIHNNSFTKFVNETEGTITQVTVSSMEIFKKDFSKPDHGISDAQLQKIRNKFADYLDEYLPFISEFNRTIGGGYAIVNVKGDEVSVDYYHGGSVTASFSWKLK